MLYFEQRVCLHSPNVRIIVPTHTHAVPHPAPGSPTVSIPCCFLSSCLFLCDFSSYTLHVWGRDVVPLTTFLSSLTLLSFFVSLFPSFRLFIFCLFIVFSFVLSLCNSLKRKSLFSPLSLFRILLCSFVLARFSIHVWNFWTLFETYLILKSELQSL